jgi:hypothetical protein
MFCKLFGYSFVALRFSMLPLDIGVAVFSYLLARGADLRPSATLCLSLTLCLSPLFLPLALSFMTDVPALCYTLVSLYALMRAGRSAPTRQAILWLAIGLLTGIIGGMTRQTVWIAPLCIIPYVIIIRRSDRAFVATALFAWLLVVLDIVLCLRWFARQPNVYLDPPLIECIRHGFSHPGIMISNIIIVVFTTVMFALPAALPFTAHSLQRLWRQRNSWRSAVTAAVILGLSTAMAFRPSFGIAPWMYNIVTPKGVMGASELSGNRPTVLPLVARGIVSALVLTTTYLLAARSIEFAVDFRRSFERLRYFFAVPTARPILAIFAIFYSALLVIRAAQDQVWDRYCLPLVPCLAIFLLRRRSLAFAWPLLVIYAMYGLASTQDNLALAAARRVAVDRLESRGVPRTQIAAGLEYDFYTQLEESGQINRFGISNPSRPFNELEGYTPAMKCKYRLESRPASDTEPSPFGTVDYLSWLPPFHRRIYIDQFRNPWWLDRNQPAGSIPPMNFETDYED